MITAALWVLMNASIVADWHQTRQIATEQIPYTMVVHPDGSSTEIFGGKPQWQEQNPILGGHPSRGKVDAYFIGTLALHNAVMIALPKKYRPYYAGGVTAVEAYFVISNNQIGIKIDF